jgi:hypothetical protein
MEHYICVGIFILSMIIYKIIMNTQIMHFILCYQKHVIGINSRIQTRKGQISYYKANGITIFFKHVDV